MSIDKITIYKCYVAVKVGKGLAHYSHKDYFVFHLSHEKITTYMNGYKLFYNIRNHKEHSFVKSTKIILICFIVKYELNILLLNLMIQPDPKITANKIEFFWRNRRNLQHISSNFAILKTSLASVLLHYVKIQEFKFKNSKTITKS